MQEKDKNVYPNRERIAEMKQEVSNLQMYTDVLSKNSDAILKALEENNTKAIEDILIVSEIPEDRIRGILAFLHESYDGHHEPW